MTREHYDQQLQELDEQILGLGDLVAQTINRCIDALANLNVEAARQLISDDTHIDDKRYDTENRALLLIATQQPLAGDLRTIAAVLTIATELERIGDYCEGIAKLTLRMAAEYEPTPIADIRTMAAITVELLQQALDAFRNRDVEAAGEVWSRDDEVDALYAQVFRKMVADMVMDKASIRQATYLLWVSHNVERMADRVTNIAERVAFVVTGDVTAFRDRLRAQTLPT